MLIHQHTIRVRYAETDQMGVVYHGNYITYLEVGRVEYMRSIGFVYKDFEKERRLLKVYCRYKKIWRSIYTIRSFYYNI